MRAALQVEAEHDGAHRQPFRRVRDQRVARRGRQQARHDDEKGQRRHAEDGDDFPAGETQHGAKIDPGFGARAPLRR